MLHFCSGTLETVCLAKRPSSPVDVFLKSEYVNGGRRLLIPSSASSSRHRLRSIAGGNSKQEHRPHAPISSKLQTPDLLQFNKKEEAVPVKGTVVLQRKSVLGLNDPRAELLDAASEILHEKVSMQLISVDADPETGGGKKSGFASLEGWLLKHDALHADEGTLLTVNFQVDKDFGNPGAFFMINHHPSEFFLKTVTLDMPDNSQIHFVCNSWVYNEKAYTAPRVFFSNQFYLPKDTPAGLATLRSAELLQLRGDGTGERKDHERIYDYDVYNDLARPEKGPTFRRPTLGGSADFPYPRRCRTGRKPSKTDPTCESPVEGLKMIYLPRDEFWGRQKLSDFLESTLKSLGQDMMPAIEAYLKNRDSFKNFEEVENLYQTGLDLKKHTESISVTKERVHHKTPLDFINDLTHPDLHGTGVLRYPVPQVMQDNKEAWTLDEEFARQLLAGMNPLVIEQMKTFPPVSNLDPAIYGSPTSAITEKHIADKLEGLSVPKALEHNKLFILDFHDTYLPCVEEINAMDGKIYATRCILFLTSEGTLKPVAIELTLPPATKGGDCIRRVFTPAAEPGVQKSLWQMAKAHVKINDAGVHQLESHWLRTHACVEPFIIATNRQLSALHPIYTLLKPHFKNTMNINSLGRQTLIIAGGIIESTFPSGHLSLGISSALYKSWRFDEQSLPADLIKRNMAVKDQTAKYGLKLSVPDYPYAVDALEIWSAMRSWVSEYLRIYYKDDQVVRDDSELQSWWKEVIEIGHADKKDEPWWLEMKCIDDVIEALTTLIWVSSAHHAAVNFGQYAYAGLVPNKPTFGRRLVPEEGTPEYEELAKDPETFYFKLINKVVAAVLGMTTVQLLSFHSSDEEYLGQRSPEFWTADKEALEAFNKFASRMKEIEKEIEGRNADPKLKNRRGPANVPYTLLYPSSGPGLTGQGVPNSISI